MKWDSLFTQNTEISPDKTQKIIENSSPDTLQLIDVRQPHEFKEFHLPGARHIPLSELVYNLAELSPEQETVVYCRRGTRSSAACQILRENGFAKVLNMSGGILRWQGHTAQGSAQQGLDFFLKGTFEHAFAMAYAMEEGLQQFYLILAAEATNPTIASFLQTMAKFEDGHKAKLAAQYKKTGKTLEIDTAPPIVEGGMSLEDLWSAFGDNLESPESILQLAMGFEAQAYDMYTRLSRTDKSDDVKNFYLQMAAEEQKHLDQLAAKLDKIVT